MAKFTCPKEKEKTLKKTQHHSAQKDSPMRATPLAIAVVVAATQYQDQQLSPPPSSSAATCDHPNTCTRRSSGGELEANVAVILIILLCALICALALNIAIRCSLRRTRQLNQTQHMRKPNMQGEVQPPSPPTLVFSAGMRLAGGEAECVICMSEFMEGEGIRVLGRCKHGFHVHCIHQWLSSHSSCPTCRASCLPPSLSSSDEESGTISHSSAPDRFG